MAQSLVTHALCDKRAELVRLVADLERQAHNARADLAHLDATIKMFDPTIKPTAIRAKSAAPTRSPHFEAGEIARRCRDAMRVAGPEGTTAKIVAALALAEKGISPDNAVLAADFAKRMYWTLTRLGQEGVAHKIGQGYGARWAAIGEG